MCSALWMKPIGGYRRIKQEVDQNALLLKDNVKMTIRCHIYKYFNMTLINKEKLYIKLRM